MNQLFELVVDFIRELKLWAIVLWWQKAVRVRAGKHVKNLEPGVYFKLPILDHIRVFPARAMYLNPGLLDVTLADNKTTLSMGAAVQFHITDPAALLDSVHDPDDAISDMVSCFISQYARVLTPNGFDVSSMETAAKKHLDRRLDGVKGLRVMITTFVRPRVIRLLTEDRSYGPSVNAEGTIPDKL